jgi:LmbE family N-acetylglucosaminyl deacetylase
MLTHLYLSPHLDDAALSCGGLIHQQTQRGERVVVVTLCAGDPPTGALSPFAQALHERWLRIPTGGQTPTEAAAVRRAEDRAALQTLGVEAIHWGVPDCIYRTDPQTGAHLYASEAALFGEWRAAEQPLAERLADDIKTLCHSLGPVSVYAPLGIGHHVDHQLARRAAELTGLPLAYFEDYPYAAREPFTGLWGGLARSPEGRALTPERIVFTETDLHAKCRAIAQYASQLSSFWPDEAAMQSALREFSEHVGGGALAERVWRL